MCWCIEKAFLKAGEKPSKEVALERFFLSERRVVLLPYIALGTLAKIV